MMTSFYEQMQKDLYAGDMEKVEEAVRIAVEQTKPAEEILREGLIAGMDIVGRDFREGILFIPEVLMCARAMHAGLDVIQPLLAKSGIKPMGKIVIGTVKGDLHDIGKNLVGMMMKGAGFEVIDLGTDVTPDAFVEAVRKEGAQLIGMSALLTTTMPSMKVTIEALKEAGLDNSIKVLVGGAPVTSNYAEQIGADEYGADAAAAVDIARNLLA